MVQIQAASVEAIKFAAHPPRKDVRVARPPSGARTRWAPPGCPGSRL